MAARPGRVAALVQQHPPEIVAEGAAWSAGEAEERVTAALADEALPASDVVMGAGVESGGVGNTDVEIVPWVALDEKARDVPNPWLVDAARTPILVLGAAKIPCDAPHRDEVIPAVGSSVMRLFMEPPQHHLAVAIAILCG